MASSKSSRFTIQELKGIVLPLFDLHENLVLSQILNLVEDPNITRWDIERVLNTLTQTYILDRTLNQNGERMYQLSNFSDLQTSILNLLKDE